MKLSMVCGLIVAVGSVWGMDEKVNWTEIWGEGQKGFKNPEESQPGKIEQELGDFIDKNKEQQEDQLAEWKNIDLRKAVSIAAKAEEMEIKFENGTPLVDALCEWIVDRLNRGRYQELSEKADFKAIKSNIENAVALILIKKSGDKKLAISIDAIKKACQEENFWSNMFKVLSEKGKYATVGTMSEKDFCNIMELIVPNEYKQHGGKCINEKEAVIDENVGMQESKNYQKTIKIEEPIDNSDDTSEVQFERVEKLKNTREEENNDIEDDDGSNELKDEKNINLQNNEPKLQPTYWNRFTEWLNDKKKLIFTTLGLGTAIGVYYLWNTTLQNKK